MENEYRILKLKSGEQIITKITGQRKDSITVVRPYEFESILMADPMGRKKEVTVLKDWLRHSDQIKTTIPKDFIASFLNPDMNVVSLYEESKERDDVINNRDKMFENMTEEEAQKMLEGKIQSLLEALKNGFDEEMSEDNMENIDPVSGMPNKGSEKEFVVMNMILPPSIIKDFIKEGFLDEDDIMSMLSDKDMKEIEDHLLRSTFTDEDTSDETDRDDYGSQWTDWTNNPHDLLDSENNDED